MERFIRRVGLGLRVCVLWGVLSCLGSAHADPVPDAARVGRVAALSGGAQVWDPQERQWFRLIVNRPVSSGDRMQVERDSRLELQFGSLDVFAAAGSELEVVRLDDEALTLRVIQGSVVARVQTVQWAQELNLQTDECGVKASGSGLIRLDRQAVTASSAVSALRGGLQVVVGDSRLDLAAGQRLEVGGPGSVLNLRSIEPSQDPWADWIAARDQMQPAGSVPQSAVGAEITGLDALDRHGRWDTHPEMGWVWMPSAVRVDWEPFRYGRWAWVRPWGWTWIDDMPWGFAPSHYGVWLQWRNRWVWWPGHAHRKPVYAPAIGSWGGSGGVVWRSKTPPPRTGWRPNWPHDRPMPAPLAGPDRALPPAPVSHGPGHRLTWPSPPAGRQPGNPGQPAALGHGAASPGPASPPRDAREPSRPDRRHGNERALRPDRQDVGPRQDKQRQEQR